MPSILRKNLARDYALTLSWRYAEVEFLGLPKLKDERVFRLEHIYVPLRLCRNLADRFAEEKTFYVPKALQEARRLVVLGDPGSGKSTLVKVLTYAFGEADSNAYKRACGELIPIPIILRNYKTRQWRDYNDMLDDFITTLDEDIRNQITAEWLLGYLREGKAILFVDGLDEVGSGEDRKHLRDKVVRPLLRDTPNSYAVLTSRIVGYDEVPFEGYVDLTKYSDDDPYRWASVSINRLYVAPFNDDEILQFITRWYQLRESLPDKQREGVDSLMSALNQNDRVKRLAHNPQLLTLMALIHRVTANLPSGRVELYDKIVEAYLETIQVYRKLGTPAKLDEMKRWLAKVGWEMQVRREEEISKSPGSNDDLLVSREEIRQWLIEAIAKERGGAEASEIADHFLDYVAKRSGLLVPRGPEEFAFAHLTFQEYFAAFELRGRVRRFDDLAATCAKLVTKRYWHETLNVMFEMLTEFHGACDDLFDLMVKEADDQISTAEFFSALLLDEQSGLSPAKQQQAAQFALAQTCHRFNDSIISNLRQLAPSQFASWVAQPMMQQLQTAQPEALEPAFFLAGRVLLKDWSQLLSKMIDKRGVLNWNEDQVTVITMIGGSNANLLEWAAERLPLRVWLAPVSLDTWGEEDMCLAEANLDQILNTHMRSPRCYLLAQSAFALSGSEIQALRIMILVKALKIDLRRYLDISLDKNISLYTIIKLTLFPTSIKSSEYIHRAVARSLARYMIRYLDTTDSQSSYKAELLGVAIGSSRLGQIDNGDELISIGCDVEWLAFQLNREKEQAATVARLRRFLSADDDWTRLQAINNLITLNVGTPELCAERNRLLDLALEEPGKFTFPRALREVTKSRDFITKEFPEAIRIIFLHEPGNSLLKPEWFDSNSEESRFFLSPPSEFFALAAKVLDPDGKTELVKKLNM